MEADDGSTAANVGMEIYPAQLLFIHQGMLAQSSQLTLCIVLIL